jgi:hypothetical protein
MKLTELPKLYSVQLASLLAVLLALEPLVPQLSEVLPTGWGAFLATLIVVARAVPQNIDTPEGRP